VQKCERSKGRIFAVYTWFFFERNKMHLALETKLDKIVIVGGSNNPGVWRRSSQPPEANGGSGAKSPTLRRFLVFFPKKYAFLSILWSKFLLKTRLKWLQKVCCCAPKACAPGRVPPPHFVTRGRRRRKQQGLHKKFVVPHTFIVKVYCPNLVIATHC